MGTAAAVGDGPGDDPMIPAILASRGWDPPVPGQIGDGDGDGDRGVPRAALSVMDGSPIRIKKGNEIAGHWQVPVCEQVDPS
jgi:hypothetical protein